MNKLNKQINVLYLLSSLQVGGLEKLLVDLIKSSEKESKNVNLTIVVMNDEINEELKKELLSTKYKIYFLKRKQGHKSPKYLFQLLDIINKNDIDLVHTHNSGGKNWAILCKLLQPKLKLVHTVHNSVSLDSLNKINILIHRNFIDMTIAISSVIYQDYRNERILKTIKIYNGVDVKNFTPKKMNAQNKDSLNIINVARITYRIKGQDILIKALGECKNKGMKFVCNFVGGVYEYDVESFDYLKNLVKELNLENEINFLGNRNDVDEVLSQSDLFILPSRYEGLPISLLEAMASNLPVIASNISGSNDLIKSGENGLLFESENHLDLADKIMYLYDNREKMEELAKNAYEYVQNFDISVMYEKYCEVYKSLV